MRIIIKGFDTEDSERLANQVKTHPVCISKHINKIAEIVINNGNIEISKEGGRWSDEIHEFIA